MGISLPSKTIILCCLLLITGCDKLEKAEKNKDLAGALHGFVSCIEKNANKFTSNYSIRNMCAKKYHTIQDKVTTLWGANISDYDDGDVTISISGVNKDDFIITQIEIDVWSEDKEEKEDSWPVTIENLWIEPEHNITTSTILEFPFSWHLKDAKDYCFKKNATKPCKDWKVKKVWGIKII